MITNQVLATYPFICRLSAESRRLLEAGANVLNVVRGERLLRKGDRMRGLYLVLSGRLRVYSISVAGDEATLYSVEPGESCPLALNSMLTEKPHQAWVEAETKAVRLLFIPGKIFRNLYDNESGVREFTLEVLSSRISSLMAVLEDLSLQSLGERLRAHLRRAADDRGEVETTHQKIALTLGTAREVVSRKLRELDRAGLIRAGRGRIKLLKPRKLG